MTRPAQCDMMTKRADTAPRFCVKDGTAMYLNSLTHNEKCAFFSIANSIAASDGAIREKEAMMLQSYLEEMAPIDELPVLPLDEALAMLEDAPVITKRKLYFELVGITMCDDEYARREKSVLTKISDSFGLPREEASEIAACVAQFTELRQKLNYIIHR